MDTKMRIATIGDLIKKLVLLDPTTQLVRGDHEYGHSPVLMEHFELEFTEYEYKCYLEEILTAKVGSLHI